MYNQLPFIYYHLIIYYPLFPILKMFFSYKFLFYSFSFSFYCFWFCILSWWYSLIFIVRDTNKLLTFSLLFICTLFFSFCYSSFYIYPSPLTTALPSGSIHLSIFFGEFSSIHPPDVSIPVQDTLIHSLQRTPPISASFSYHTFLILPMAFTRRVPLHLFT